MGMFKMYQKYFFQGFVMIWIILCDVLYKKNLYVIVVHLSFITYFS